MGDEKQLYPEYTIIYRRQYAADQVPDDLGLNKGKPSGTTGRFWQMRGDIFHFKGWKNVPPEVNKILIANKLKGSPPASIAIRGKSYIWNVNDLVVADDE